MKPSKLRRLRKSLEKQKLHRWRDRQTCQECGSTKNLTIHHRVPKSCGGLDRSWNYEVLCRRCHGKEHLEDIIGMNSNNLIKITMEDKK